MDANFEALRQASPEEVRFNWKQLFGTLFVSALLIALSMSLAANGASSLQFLVFWAGVLLGFAGIAFQLLSQANTPRAYRELLVILGIWGLLPRLLRGGLSPLFFDEFDHLRLAQDLSATGHAVALDHLFQLGASFPGLELLTSTTAFASTISIWHSGLLVVALAHVLGVLGVFTLVGEHRNDARQGAFAALVYACNPSWLYFHAQFSYETLAFPLLLWLLVLADRWRKNGATRSTVGVFLLVAAALPIVHHATSAIAVVLLLLWFVSAIILDLIGQQHRISRSTWSIGGATVLTAVLIVGRLFLVGSTLWKYWAPVLNVGSIGNSLRRLIGGGGGGRTLFGGAHLPWWELAAGFLLVPLLLVILARALIQSRKSAEKLDGLEVTFWLLALAFFATLPLDLVSSLSEAVHRSWGFSFLGLSAVAAGVVAPFLHRPGWWRPLTAGVVFSVIAIAGTSVGISTNYQFPGPVQVGVDGRSIGSETTLVANWFASHTGSVDHVFVDRFMSRQLAISTRADVMIPWQLWQMAYSPILYQSTLQTLQRFHVDYMVFDRRMTSILPPAGFWYSPSEPDTIRNSLVPKENLDRYNCYDWSHVVATTRNYEVVAVDLQQVALDHRVGSIGARTGCLPPSVVKR